MAAAVDACTWASGQPTLCAGCASRRAACSHQPTANSCLLSHTTTPYASHAHAGHAGGDAGLSSRQRHPGRRVRSAILQHSNLTLGPQAWGHWGVVLLAPLLGILAHATSSTALTTLHAAAGAMLGAALGGCASRSPASPDFPLSL